MPEERLNQLSIPSIEGDANAIYSGNQRVCKKKVEKKVLKGCDKFNTGMMISRFCDIVAFVV